MIKRYCPLCQKEKTEFEIHHIIWRMDGGTDDPVNLLPICRTCHHTINYGDPADSVELEKSALLLRLWQYGLDFILKSGLLTGNHRLKNNVLEAFKIDPNISASEIDLLFKKIGASFTGERL